MVLDSIGALQTGFEGCEKKLEVDFEGADLRTLPQSAWVSILEKAQCTIITRAENDHFIAFVLSESSLFVFPHKVILKTCGTTSLLFGLPQLLEVAEAHGATPNFVQFSRSNFMFPELQPFPHSSFDSEVVYLNKFLHGQPYILGPLDGPRWNLYIADFDTSVNLSKDQTLEIIMFNLDPEKMKPFYRLEEEKSAETDENLKHNGRTSTKMSGIDQLIEGATVDSHLFSPCGYSCNGLKDGAYFTIHVTPEPECSFVSFETNVRMTDYTPLVRKVLDTFAPAAFSLYLFVDNESVPQNSHTSLNWDIDGFTRMGHTYHDFEGMYNLSVGNYTSQQDPNRPQFGARFAVPKATPTEAAEDAASLTTGGDYDDEDEAKFQLEQQQRHLDLAMTKTLSDGGESSDSDEQSVSSCASQNPEGGGSSTRSSSASPPSSPTASLCGSENGDFEESDGSAAARGRGGLEYAASRILGSDELTSVALSAVRDHCPVRSFDASCSADFDSVVSSIIDATDIGKAFFVVDLSALVARFVEWSRAMPRVRPFYGIQCNSDPALILAMSALGCGFSGPSMRQVDTLLSLGVEPSDILFSNPWPSISELRLVRERGIGFLAFDNKLELQKISVHCPEARLFVMVSPVHGAHSATSRSRARPAYGTSLTNAFRLLKQSKELDRAKVVGVMLCLHDDCPPEEVNAAIESVSSLFTSARRELGISLQYLHLGSKGWDRRPQDSVAGAPTSTSPLPIADVITPTLARHFPSAGSRPVSVLAEPSSFMVESAYSIVVSLLSIRSEAVPLELPSLSSRASPNPDADASCASMLETATPPTSVVDYKLYFDYYVDDGIYRSFPFLKRRRAQLVPHVVRRPVSAELCDPDVDAHFLEMPQPMPSLPNPDTGAQQVASSSPMPSRSPSPRPHHSRSMSGNGGGEIRIVDATGAPVVPASSSIGTGTGEEVREERLFQSRIWGATCDGLDSICDSVLLPKLNPDDRLYFRDMGANTFAHATAFNGFGGLPPPHYVVFK